MRALVRGDDAALESYERRLEEQGWSAVPRFLGALFFLTVSHRFRLSDEADIIRFVAELRAVNDPNMDPRDAETLIRRVLDDAVKVSIDQGDMAEIQTLVICKALTDAELTDEELDDRLREAEELAAS